MLIFGHRGARGYAPENTMVSFNKALLLKADGVELDVQLSKDGHIVVCHDHTIDRTSNGHGLICQIELAELKRYDFGSWFSPEFRGERILTLVEFLSWFVKTSLVLNIEIKNIPVIYEGIEEKVVDCIMQWNIADRVIVSSFYYPSIIKVKRLNPKIKTGALFDRRPPDLPQFIRDTAADFLHPHCLLLDKGLIESAKAKGIGINTYTVNDKNDVELVRSLGVKGIFTDYPDVPRYR